MLHIPKYVEYICVHITDNESMEKNKRKIKDRDTIRAARVKKTAGIIGVSERTVRRVINGDTDNENVMSAFMLITEGENKLLNEVKKLVPLN